jgi:hypothetical protein
MAMNNVKIPASLGGDDYFIRASFFFIHKHDLIWPCGRPLVWCCKDNNMNSGLGCESRWDDNEKAGRILSLHLIIVKNHAFFVRDNQSEFSPSQG